VLIGTPRTAFGLPALDNPKTQFKIRHIGLQPRPLPHGRIVISVLQPLARKSRWRAERFWWVPPAAAAVMPSEQALTMMVVGSMVGAGIWSLPRAFGTATGVFGAIIAWLIAAGGMYTLVLQRSRSVSLTSTPAYAYAKAGLGVPDAGKPSPPQKFAANRCPLNETARIRMNRMIGRTLGP